METALNRTLDEIAATDKVKSVLATDEEGLCLGVRGKATPSTSGTILSIASRASRIEKLLASSLGLTVDTSTRLGDVTVLIETDQSHILIRQDDGKTFENLSEMVQPINQTTFHSESLAVDTPASQHQSLPTLPPEVWTRIFFHSCKTINQLSQISRLNKYVYGYCWLSPAAKANFFINRHGKQLAIYMAFKTKCWTIPEFQEIMKSMILNGCSFSCHLKGVGCPLQLLSGLPNAVDNIKLFYTCKPHISDKHLNTALYDAVNSGRLNIISALLQEDLATLTPLKLFAHLKTRRINFDIEKLRQNNYTELVIALAMGSGQFSAKAVALAIRDNQVAKAQEMISLHLKTTSASVLNEADSNNVWLALGIPDIGIIESALKAGVSPTGSSLLISSGLFSSPLNLERIIRLSSWEHMPNTVLSPTVVQANDILLKATDLINQVVITNAVSTGHKEYVEYLLTKWQQQHNYTSLNILSTHTFHNAFLRRDWNLVELLIDACRRWAEQANKSGEDFVHLLAGPEPVDESDFVPVPSSASDEYYFTRIPELVNLGVYPTDVFTLSLERMARISTDDEFAKTEECMVKLLEFGAVVTSKALYNATLNRSDTSKSSLRFKFLLDKFALDPQSEFKDFGYVIGHKCLEDVQLILAKGIPVTAAILGALYEDFSNLDHPVVGEVLSAVKPGNSLLKTYFGQITETFHNDLDNYNYHRTKAFIVKLQEYGFWVPQEVLDQVQASGNKPLLLGILKMVTKEEMRNVMRRKQFHEKMMMRSKQFGKKKK
ncbi:hypothetical protein BCR33DRAFT_857137 [Rhizoclosmatium globosum]|uniref:Late endosomal/lysosomal adaptor and MAPK and MTOR activator 5 n=1 Tax=Rhizoclosmatium globosum TaxID=329046 RepID=A0A1Y2B8V7_9FUNG|nr:hypothetical protein BCR33DRAFT_857137 [Rhizoclosmatium globosum]|eukprot:ORY31184.1 hypothetical protein BCR33DRAFT_857137 [Rhizoclosmatium globosum]